MTKLFFFNFCNFSDMINFFLTKLLASKAGIALTFFPTNSSYAVFLPISFFTKSLSLLKSTGVVSHLPISDLSIPYFEEAKSLLRN